MMALGNNVTAKEMKATTKVSNRTAAYVQAYVYKKAENDNNNNERESDCGAFPNMTHNMTL